VVSSKLLANVDEDVVAAMLAREPREFYYVARALDTFEAFAEEYGCLEEPTEAALLPPKYGAGPLTYRSSTAATSKRIMGAASVSALTANATFKGVAIVFAGTTGEANTTNGTLGRYQLSKDGGATWTDVAGGLTDGTAVYADKTALIRYAGATGVEAINPQNLTVRLIDNSGLTGTASFTAASTGNTINASVNGGATAFSGGNSGGVGDTVTINLLNRAPVSSDADGVVVGDAFGVAMTVTESATKTQVLSKLLSYGSTPTANIDESALVPITGSPAAIVIDFSPLSIGDTGVENIRVKINGVPYKFTLANLSNFIPTFGTAPDFVEPLLSADGFAVMHTGGGEVSGRITITAKDVGAPITSVEVMNDVISGTPNGINAKVYTVPASAGSISTAAQSVEALFGPTYTDADFDTMRGVTITSAGTASDLSSLGKYQYQIAGTTTWVDMPAGLNDSGAVFLAKADLIRFVTSSTNTSLVNKQDLTARLVDDSAATAPASGSTVNVSANGGSTPYSGNAVTLQTPAAGAPVNTVPGTQSVNEDTQLAISGLSVTDPEGNLASTQLSVQNGTLNVTVASGASISAGTNDSGTLTISGTQSAINTTLGSLKYQGVLNYNGTDLLSVVSKDSTNASSGTSTVTINVAPVNDAPVLADTSLALPAVIQDAAAPSGAVGTLISSLVGGVTDVDTGAVKGIAITSVANGTLYYSTNGGTNWTAYTGTASDTNALLLSSDTDNRIYFKPTAGYSGTANNVTFRAWDQTTGTEGNYVATATNGGTTAFSSATDTVSEQVVRPVTINTVSTDSIIAMNEAMPLTGTANPGATVNLNVGGTTRTVVADASGNWSYSTKLEPVVRYVMVRKDLNGSFPDTYSATGIFTIADIKVNSGATNLAAGQAVSTGTGNTMEGSVTYLTDSQTSTYYETSEAGEQWVQLDLGGYYRVDSVQISARDGWQSRANGANIFMSAYNLSGKTTAQLNADVTSGLASKTAVTNIASGLNGFTATAANAADHDNTGLVTASELVSGVSSSASTTVTWRPFDKLAIVSAVDNTIGATPLALGSGSLTGDTTPTLQGTLVAPLVGNEEVAIWWGNQYRGTATVTGTTWSWTPPSGMAAGTYVIDALVTQGNKGPAIQGSNVFTLTIGSAPTVAITSATVNDTTSVTTDEIIGTQGNQTKVQPFEDTFMKVETFNSDGTQAVLARGITVGNYNGGWGIATGSLFNGGGDVGLVVYNTENFSGNATAKTMKTKVTSKIGSFKAVSFDYADLQDLANLSTNSGYTGGAGGTVNFYKADNTLIQSVSINANSAGNGLAATFTWTSPGASASYFEILTSYDTFGLDTFKFTSGADTLSINGTTMDTTPQLNGSLSGALLSGQVVSIYEGATLLGNATVTGTTWTFTVPTTTVAAHTYTAKVMSGTTVLTTSSNFVVNVAATPLVLDLNNDGVQTVGIEEGVQFDLLATGTPQNVGWVSKQDGLLAMDLDGDGQINNGTELFGDHTVLADGSYAQDGWAALAAQDSNTDGVIDAKDANFDKLRVWVDADTDGVTDDGELRTLAEAKVQSIHLNHDANSVQQNGNVVQAFSSYTRTDGSTQSIADVGFQVRYPGQAEASSDGFVGENKPYELSAEEMAQLGLPELAASLVTGANAEVIDAIAEVSSEVTASLAVCTGVADSSTYSLSNGQSLDLTQVLKDMSVNGIVKGLEQVDMATDTAANVVSLSLADVLSLPSTDGVYKLILSGAANDKVMLTEGEWTDTGAVLDQGGHAYAVYTGTNDSSAQLLIDQHMLQSH
jgi:hypothetical protein